MSQYIPAIASAIGSAASQAPAIINDSAQEQSNAGVTQNQAPGTNPQGAINATNQVAQTTNNAIAAQNAPAQYAKQKGTEQGEFVLCNLHLSSEK